MTNFLKFKRPILGAVLAGTIIIVDQISKLLVLDLFHGPAEAKLSVPVVPFFDLVLVWNRGVSFGMFNDASVMPFVLIAVAAVLVGFVGRWLLRAETLLEAAAFGLIIGGAIGNVIDRVRLGAVVDFLDFHLNFYGTDAHFPAFNVADSAICVGAGLILYLWGVRGKTNA